MNVMWQGILLRNMVYSIAKIFERLIAPREFRASSRAGILGGSAPLQSIGRLQFPEPSFLCLCILLL